MTRVEAGFHVSDVDGRRLRGIPSLPTPQVIVPGPAERRPIRDSRSLPLSIRYMSLTGGKHIRYSSPTVQGLGNRQRNVLPADVWIVGNRYNKTRMYRPPVAVANPTWRIANVTNKDITHIEKLQMQKRMPPR